MCFVTSKHTLVPVLLSITPLGIGDLQQNVSMIVTDLTEQKHNEEQTARQKIVDAQQMYERKTHAQVQIERDRLAESQEQLKLVVEGAKDFAMFTIDPSGNVLSWNKGAERLLRFSEKEIIGKNFSVFFTPEDVKNSMPELELKTVLETGQANDDNWLVRKDGSKFWASGVSTAVIDKAGNLKGITKIARDATLHMQPEQRKDDFIGIASHELKTPVTSVKAYTQILQKLLAAGHIERAKNILDRMDHQLNKLNGIVSDLLDVSRIQTSNLQLHTEKITSEALIAEITEYQQLVDTHTIVIDCETQKPVIGDKDRIIQVLNNLLSNAVKYSAKGSEIIVRIYDDRKNFILSVKDFGAGIAIDEQKKIFDRFYRIEETGNAMTFGQGLGLYISAGIIKHHGGKIWVESQVGKGSIFYISLPLVTAKQSARTGQSPHGYAARQSEQSS